MQVAASLPKSSNFKLVDVWLLFCIFSSFIIIVFHVIIDLLQFAEAREALRGPVTLVSGLGGMVEKKPLPSHTKEEGHAQTTDRFRGFPYNGVQFGWESKEEKLKGSPTAKGIGRRFKIRLTMKSMENFGRVFVAFVFFVFNAIYWLTAYTTR